MGNPSEEKIKGLGNVFGKGTQGLNIVSDQEESTIHIPTNEDWFFFATVAEYTEETGIGKFKKVWDEASPQEEFKARAEYIGKSGIPKATEVVVGRRCYVCRVGKDNNTITDTTGYQLNTSSTTKASFIALFPPSSTVELEYARIAWNFDNTTDLCEAELLAYNAVADTFSAKPEPKKVWIDYNHSRACNFWTVGDQTIFIVEKLLDSKTRGSDTRPLYFAKFCFRDLGTELFYFHMTDKTKSVGKPLGNGTPWTSDPPIPLKTTIISTPVDNLFAVRVVEEWKANGAGNSKLWEISDFSRGLDIWVVPIDPVPNTDPIASKLYNSEVQYSGSPIATYERNI